MRDQIASAISWMLALVGAALVLPMAVACWYGEYHMLPHFAVPLAASWVYVWYRGYKKKHSPGSGRDRNSFLLVGSIWIAIIAFGALPLWTYGMFVDERCLFGNVADAVFESVSGFTATGATVIADVESLPRCINFWRCLMLWLGGMGIIALALAILPMVGINTFNLMKAEASGSDRGKFTVKGRDTAKVLLAIYLSMTLTELILLHLAGLGWFDSVCHALSNAATGGFSTRNESIRSFANPAVEWICTAFMLAGAVNYACYFMLIKGRIRKFWENSELRAFVVIVLVAVAVCTFSEYRHGVAPFADTLRRCAFEVAAVISTTGFMASDYTQWLPSAQMVVFVLCLVGGCSGSTSGGVKVVRWTILWKQLKNDVSKLRHPHGVYTLRLDGIPGRERVVPSVSAFVFVYFMLVLVTALAASFSGMDVMTSIAASLAMVGNIGPAFGDMGPAGTYASVSPAVKWIFSGAMLAGRLEIYTLLILVGDIARGSREAKE